MAALASLWMVGVGLSSAWAVRPDEGGLFSFDAADVLAYLDGPAGVVRVHYAVSGPNVTLLEDADGSGLPDFPEQVAATAEEVLRFYIDDLGFRPPLSEDELGLGPLGGSNAFDFYLVDFGGSADGLFSVDGCAGKVCAGFMVIENDFRGYGYASLEEATAVLTSHELFHAVQAAYNAGQPVWMSEGTAVWAEHQFLPGVPDFHYFCSAYLDDPGRSIDSPPAGSVTSFSYGTALFFQFLTERFGVGTGPDLQATMEDHGEDDAFDAVVAVITANGSSLHEEWTTFVRWNLATGLRAGALDGYPFAEDLGGVQPEARGTALHDDNRFYPLAATYFYLEDHPGGTVRFATAEDPSGLTFSLHATDASGAVTEALLTWSPTAPEDRSLGDLDAGSYWLVGTYPEQAPQSVKIDFCLGLDSTIDDACLPGDTDPEPVDSGEPSAPDDTDKGGCAHVRGPWQGSLGGALLGMLALMRRRHRRRVG